MNFCCVTGYYIESQVSFSLSERITVQEMPLSVLTYQAGSNASEDGCFVG